MQGEALQTEAFWEGYKRYDQYKIGAVDEIYQLDIRSKGLIEAYVKDKNSAEVFNQFAGNETDDEAGIRKICDYQPSEGPIQLTEKLYFLGGIPQTVSF